MLHLLVVFICGSGTVAVTVNDYYMFIVNLKHIPCMIIHKLSKWNLKCFVCAVLQAKLSYMPRNSHTSYSVILRSEVFVYLAFNTASETAECNQSVRSALV